MTGAGWAILITTFLLLIGGGVGIYFYTKKEKSS